MQIVTLGALFSIRLERVKRPKVLSVALTGAAFLRSVRHLGGNLEHAPAGFEFVQQFVPVHDGDSAFGHATGHHRAALATQAVHQLGHLGAENFVVFFPGVVRVSVDTDGFPAFDDQVTEVAGVALRLEGGFFPGIALASQAGQTIEVTQVGDDGGDDEINFSVGAADCCRVRQ